MSDRDRTCPNCVNGGRTDLYMTCDPKTLGHERGTCRAFKKDIPREMREAAVAWYARGYDELASIVLGWANDLEGKQ